MKILASDHVKQLYMDRSLLLPCMCLAYTSKPESAFDHEGEVQNILRALSNWTAPGSYPITIITRFSTM